jgi:hypothetical protein
MTSACKCTEPCVHALRLDARRCDVARRHKLVIVIYVFQIAGMQICSMSLSSMHRWCLPEQLQCILSAHGTPLCMSRLLNPCPVLRLRHSLRIGNASSSRAAPSTSSRASCFRIAPPHRSRSVELRHLLPYIF